MHGLRIAVVAPPWYEVPPVGYGGIEAVVGALVDALVARGHTVGLVSAGSNGTNAESLTTLAEAEPTRLGDDTISLLHGLAVEELLRGFEPDVVHDHTLPGLVAAPLRPWPTVATVHGRVAGHYGDLIRASSADVSLVALSDDQRASAPRLPWVATVHNGVDVGRHPLGLRRGDDLLFLGRMHPEKGVAEAIEVARAAGRRLLIAARLHGPEEELYFDTRVRPHLGDDVVYLGEQNESEKLRLLATCAALLFPLQWDEPYGMVVAEAQACGTPVLSLRRGAIPELVRHGETGFLAYDHLALVPYVDRVGDLSPTRIRAHAQAELDISRTALGYEQVFERVLGRRPRTRLGWVPSGRGTSQADAASVVPTAG
jgi:glycosyltransferase involved in cell wall biosynthesis